MLLKVVLINIIFDIEIDEDFVPVYEYFNVQLSKPIIEFKPERHIDIDEYNDDYVRKK